ncbi:MAG TPA: hypothetical protein ENI64_13330 [Gammaproteobacteria bacterium]|nr:hypothetical protein [Gammaproteobacteria bacterium]
MKPDDHKQDLPENLAAISDLLDRSAEQLDQETLTALSQARAQAVQAARDAGKQSNQPSKWQGWLWPAGGLATAIAAGLAVIMLNSAPVNLNGELGTSEFEILASNETLEVIEDLEFYQWLSDAALDDPGESG